VTISTVPDEHPCYIHLTMDQTMTPEELAGEHPSDAVALRSMAERWDNPSAPDCIVKLAPGVEATAGYVLRLVARAMNEAGER
jgi:hypothetical protein